MDQIQMKTCAFSHRIRTAVVTIGLALVAMGCNTDDSEVFSIDGTWTGSLAELEFELTMLLAGEGKEGIDGLAEFSSPPTGPVQGDVSGTRKGKKVDFTIEIEEAIVGGSLVFDGAFVGNDTMTGTLDSGLLGGSWPFTFQREES